MSTRKCNLISAHTFNHLSINIKECHKYFLTFVYTWDFLRVKLVTSVMLKYIKYPFIQVVTCALVNLFNVCSCCFASVRGLEHTFMSTQKYETNFPPYLLGSLNYRGIFF